MVASTKIYPVLIPRAMAVAWGLGYIDQCEHWSGGVGSLVPYLVLQTLQIQFGVLRQSEIRQAGLRKGD